MVTIEQLNERAAAIAEQYSYAMIMDVRPQCNTDAELLAAGADLAGMLLTHAMCSNTKHGLASQHEIDCAGEFLTRLESALKQKTELVAE